MRAADTGGGGKESLGGTLTVPADCTISKAKILANGGTSMSASKMLELAKDAGATWKPSEEVSYTAKEKVIDLDPITGISTSDVTRNYLSVTVNQGTYEIKMKKIVKK